MNYELIGIWIVFLFCASLTVTGILLLFRLRKKNTSIDIRHLHYAQILFYSYGLYVLWGKLFVEILLAKQSIGMNAEVAIAFNQLMGVPFVFLAFVFFNFWLKVINKSKQVWAFFAGIFVALLLLSTHIIFYEYTLLNDAPQINQVLITICASLTILHVLLGIKADAKRIALTLAVALALPVLMALLQMFVLPAYKILIAVYAFFYSIAFTAASSSLFIMNTGGMVQAENKNEEWTTTFGITRREAEVIEKITAGMTNQQIADHLFISLQTVKDHNSRIYQKLDVRNRAQLIRKVHELI